MFSFSSVMTAAKVLRPNSERKKKLV